MRLWWQGLLLAQQLGRVAHRVPLLPWAVQVLAVAAILARVVARAQAAVRQRVWQVALTLLGHEVLQMHRVLVGLRVVVRVVVRVVQVLLAVVEDLAEQRVWAVAVGRCGRGCLLGSRRCSM
jgi:hypothetical protein